MYNVYTFERGTNLTFLLYKL